MPLIFETPQFNVARDKIGHWLIQSKASGKSVYLQGDDARQFGREIARVPASFLDYHIDQYAEVLS
jgi:hypothetical protein